jgi:hypothetical protein
MNEYKKIRFKFLSKPENRFCKARIPGVCMGRRVQGIELTIHHKRGRGKYLLDVKTWLPCCLACHEFIHNNIQIAYDLGFCEKRLTEDDKDVDNINTI